MKFIDNLYCRGAPWGGIVEVGPIVASAAADALLCDPDPCFANDVFNLTLNAGIGAKFTAGWPRGMARGAGRMKGGGKGLPPGVGTGSISGNLFPGAAISRSSIR